MPRVKNELGNRYGKLTVLEQVGRHPTSFHVMWRCKCDCGKETVVSANKLRQGEARSCGCMQGKKFA